MRFPRWTLLAASTALVLPVAGPAFATAALDEDVSFLQALTASDSAAPDCDDEEDLDAETTDDTDVDEEAAEDGVNENLDDSVVEEEADPSGDDCPEPEPGEDEGAEEAEEESEADEGTEEESDEKEDSDEENRSTPDAEEDDEEDADGERAGHGEFVSRVAQCAPRGREARELGLNHGAFVSAAARGQVVDVDETTSFDFSDPASAQALCDFVEQQVTSDPAPETESDIDTPSAPRGNAGNAGNGPPENPGQGNARSGDSPKPGGGPPADTGAARNGGGPPAHAGNGGGGPKR